MTAPTQTELRARAQALLDAVDDPLRPTRSGVPRRLGADTIRWQAFKRDARADLWLCGLHPTFELQLTVRGPTRLDALDTLRSLVDEIFGGAA